MSAIIVMCDNCLREIDKEESYLHISLEPQRAPSDHGSLDKDFCAECAAKLIDKSYSKMLGKLR